MDAAQNGAVVESVETMVTSLEALSALFRDAAATRSRKPDDIINDRVQTAVKTVEEKAKTLHSLVSNMSSQRVLILAADRLMEAGIVLYNAARAAFKSFQSTPDDQGHDTYGARFPILFGRFMAARVMGLALSCSTGGAEGVPGEGGRHQSVFVDDCLDVLRSYGRVGSLLMETAASDREKCFEYLKLAKEALEYASSIWSQVGLSCLTRFKEGIELEEVLQDLWDFCVDRIRTARLLQCYEGDSASVTVIIETLHELQMLLPYMMGNTKTLLEIVQDALDEWNTSDRHGDLVILAEEALRLCDAVESTQDIAEESFVPAFKHSYLQRLLSSLVSLGEVEKAEACFTLLGEKDSSTLLTMTKLYLRNQETEKAVTVLKCLFQGEDITASLVGAKMYAEAHAFNYESLQIYRQLERHYGDHLLDIKLDLACALAMSELPQNRAHAMDELRRIGEMIEALPSENQLNVKSQATRLKHTIQDAAAAALNMNAHEECTAWAELGIQQATSPQEAAVFKRMIASACIKLNQRSEGRRWAMEALETDCSKESLFAVFEASLGTEDDEKCAFALDVLQQVKMREDFEPQDLLSYGYAASNAGQEGITLVIMDDLCCFIRDRGTTIGELPFGLLLQNTAQLALRVATATNGEADTPISYASSFVKYAEMFLRGAEKFDSTKIDEFASQETFIWFYTMSFNVARSCNFGSLFVRAADIAKQAERIFGNHCAISSREDECLLAALSSEMMCFDKIDRSHLPEVLAIVARIKPLCELESDYSDFLVKCELAIRLRMYDTDVSKMKDLCHEKLQKSVSSFTDIGEMILHASRFDEAASVRRQYRSLASEMFKRGLQVLLQAENIGQDSLSYLFRRLITLAESRDEILEWFEQLIQLQASVEITVSELDAEWFIAKAWNTGVQYHRSQAYPESQKFMKMALALLENLGTSLTELNKDLHKQYQDLSLLANENILTVD